MLSQKIIEKGEALLQTWVKVNDEWEEVNDLIYSETIKELQSNESIMSLENIQTEKEFKLRDVEIRLRIIGLRVDIYNDMKFEPKLVAL